MWQRLCLAAVVAMFAAPAAFAQTKLQIRQPVAERLKKSGEATDKAVTDIWAAPATLSYIREYVARTLSKS